jgi:hypothetical protein
MTKNLKNRSKRVITRQKNQKSTHLSFKNIHANNLLNKKKKKGYYANNTYEQWLKKMIQIKRDKTSVKHIEYKNR